MNHDAQSAVQPDWLRPEQIPTSAQDAQEKYDQISDTYDAFVQSANYQSPQATASILSQVVNQAEALLSFKSNVLDVGCGTGLIGQSLADVGFQNLSGCDISQNVLNEAKKKAVYSHLVQANLLESLPFALGQFDAVVCIGVFSRFSTQQILEILAEFSRITKQKGVILFSHRSDLIEESKLTDQIMQVTDFTIAQVTEPLPYVPGLSGYEKVDVQYFVLINT